MNLLKTSIFQLLLFLLPVLSMGQTLNVATYNVRYETPRDSMNAWSHRQNSLYNMIRFYDFDLFGVQEALAGQMQDIKTNLEGYDYVGVGREDGKQGGEFSAIFYRTQRLKLLKSGTFWLAPGNPEKPVKGWDASLPRICTWASFLDNSTGRRFYHFNTHFDHRGIIARLESSKLIIEQIRKIAGSDPVILGGDFNRDQFSESYKLLQNSGILKDAYSMATVRLGDNATSNGFKMKPDTSVRRIDHLFLTNDFKVLRYGVLTNSSRGRYPSDHFPVMATIWLDKKR